MTTGPERTCIGCREVDAKVRLLRMTRADGGGIGCGAPGTARGRGAYVHPTPDCIEAATRKGPLARALRTGISSEELGRLRKSMSRGAL